VNNIVFDVYKVCYNKGMKRMCFIQDCENKIIAKGYCNAHYLRLKKYGDPNYSYFGFKGQAKHPLYFTWRAMNRRCDWENSPRWEDYGGRGIKVCDRWKGRYGFVNFLEDMGNKPSQQHQLDRIDNDGDYTPENCKWSTRSENQMNKRMMKNNTTGFTGVTPFVNNRGKFYWRTRIQTKTVGYFEDFEEAVGARLTAECEYGVN